MKLHQFRQDLQDYQDFFVKYIYPVHPVDPVKKLYICAVKFSSPIKLAAFQACGWADFDVTLKKPAFRIDYFSILRLNRTDYFSIPDQTRLNGGFK